MFTYIYRTIPLTLNSAMFAMSPNYCGWCHSVIGEIAEPMFAYINYLSEFCSDRCRVMAEWHTPERR